MNFFQKGYNTKVNVRAILGFTCGMYMVHMLPNIRVVR